MGVTDLNQYREQREADDEPHISGEARCLRCRHEWQCVTPVGVVAELECPGCGCHAGVMNATTAPDSDTPVWVCNCRCDVHRITADGAVCIGCGVTASFAQMAEADWT